MQDDIEKAFNHWWEMNATLIDSKSEAASDAWLEATRQANEAHAARSGWVARESISDEIDLLDGVWDIYSYGKVVSACSFHLAEEFHEGSFADKDNNAYFLLDVTHIRKHLPPPPPQLKGGE